MLYYASACPRCRTGMVVVDLEAHRADEGALCLNCAWRPPTKPAPYIARQWSIGPRPTYEPYDPADEEPEHWRQAELRARRAQLPPLLAAGLGHNAAAERLGVSPRTISRWARELDTHQEHTRQRADWR